ncbi:glycosyltransferase family A protein [Kingella negevensis]|uniref:glycosyltransferase family A protein n=1 Tax=Kingella negevensis TaxID=1522312 RepID=UPI0032B42C67
MNAAAPFIAQEDIICFLDDDNWYREDHVASVVETFAQSQADYVYTLRNFYNAQSQFMCRDDMESLGEWECKLANQRIDIPLTVLNETQFVKTPEVLQTHMIDVNCFAMTRKTAQEIASAWCIVGLGNDGEVFKKLRELNKKYVGTGRYTVNYFCDNAVRMKGLYEVLLQWLPVDEVNKLIEDYVIRTQEAHHQLYGGRPWAKE